MKLKLVLLIVGTGVIGSSITILLRSHEQTGKRHRKQQAEENQNRLGTAISNYNQTFKLNTNPPLWPEPQK